MSGSGSTGTYATSGTGTREPLVEQPPTATANAARKPPVVVQAEPYNPPPPPTYQREGRNRKCKERNSTFAVTDNHFLPSSLSLLQILTKENPMVVATAIAMAVKEWSLQTDMVDVI